jgi:ketosteroid isomerase-like protein
MLRFITIFIFLVLTACAQQTEKQKIDLNAEEQAVRAVSMQWLDLAKKHDLPNIVLLLTDDVTFYRENNEPAVGHAAFLKIEEQYLESNPSFVPNWSTDRVEIASSGDLAVEWGTWSESGSGLDGTAEDHGRYVTVYRKVDGIWKVATDISVSTKPEETPK